MRNWLTRIPGAILLCLLAADIGASTRYLDYFFTEIGELSHTEQIDFDRALDLIGEGNIDPALPLINELAAAEEHEPGTQARLLANQAILQALVGDVPGALSLLDQAVALVESRAGPFDSLLVNLLSVRGLIQRDQKELDLAEQSFRRAQHITHRQDGVYSRRQLGIVDLLTDLHLQQGLVLAADREQRFNLKISEQAYGANSDSLVPILERLGGYFAQRGDTIPLGPSHIVRPVASEADAYTEQYRATLFKESIDLFERAIAIIENTYGPTDLRLIEPLHGIAKARLRQRTARKFAEEAMERAVNIVANNPATDTADHARALVSLGDIYNLTSDSRANDTYLAAWRMLNETPELADLQYELFGAPTRLFPEDLSTIVLERQPAAIDADTRLFVDAEFTVIDSGRVANVRILDGNVPNDQKNTLRRHIRSWRFRPRIVDDEFVTTESLMVHQNYIVIRPQPTVELSVDTNSPLR